MQLYFGKNARKKWEKNNRSWANLIIGVPISTRDLAKPHPWLKFDPSGEISPSYMDDGFLYSPITYYSWPHLHHGYTLVLCQNRIELYFAPPLLGYTAKAASLISKGGNNSASNYHSWPHLQHGYSLVLCHTAIAGIYSYSGLAYIKGK